MRLLSLALFVFLSLSLTACDSSADFEIGGTYSGTFEDEGAFNEADLTISDTPSGGTFTFRYDLTQNDGRGPNSTTASGTGTYDHPAITLTVGDETVDATVSDDGDTIRLDAGDGFIITLIR